MICFPLDDTPYEAKDMGAYLGTRTRGVYSADDNLKVSPGAGGMTVSVSAGLAWLKRSAFWGTAALQEQALTLTLDTADGVLGRIDVIVCRLNIVNNYAEIMVKKGAFSSAPIMPTPLRNNSYDEIYLASVTVRAGMVKVTASDITDTRTDEKVCGLMRDGVTGLPSAQFYAQMQALIDELRAAIDATYQEDSVKVKDHATDAAINDIVASTAV